MPIPAKNAEKPLQNAKHEAVLQAYIADKERIGFKAYLVVYPKSSAAAAATGFSRLLKNADIARRLSFLDSRVTEKVVERAAVTIQGVIDELAKIGFANMLDYTSVDGEGEPRVDLSALTRDQSAAIQHFTIEDFVDARSQPDETLEPQAKGGKLKRKKGREVRKVTFKLYDKRAALVDIGNHLGMFKQLHEHTGKDGKPLPSMQPIININGKKRSGA